MSSQGTVRVTLQCPPVSSAAQLLARTSRSSNDAEESELLKSIRAALRGPGTEPVSAVHSSTFVHGWTETEITWNTHTVVLSSGGIIQKQWNLDEEGQPIQWACVGLYQLTPPINSRPSNNAARYASGDDGLSSHDDSHESTFGLFTLAQREREREVERSALCPAVFVFLRSIGKIFLLNGIEYTFSLPFIVRKAWPLYPHGVMIQRVLDPTEIEEAELTGDTTLPTIFSVTSPFSEAASVGLTNGILGGCDGVADTLKDEDENTSRPLKSVPATETVVWVSHRGPDASDDVLVTVDTEKHQLSIWRYVYIKPKDTPLPLGRSKTHKRNPSRKRASVPGPLPGSRRQSAMVTELIDRRDNLFHPSPNTHDLNQSPTPEFPEMPPFSALPGRPPALSTTTTMASLVTGPSQWSASDPGRRPSQGRNDLSVTMDRMVLGGRMDVEAALAPVEHGRMKAAYWMEKLHAQNIPDIECVHKFCSCRVCNELKLVNFIAHKLGLGSRSPCLTNVGMARMIGLTWASACLPRRLS
jgi:anaphase-promoting complex subunit 1